ncbi:hypothetical protein ABZ930_15720 [Streptomyces sp. NPDC046716]|uniref:hypothetical protein n=1 Tax=Streptomyces sp. NPDC046716 TaxID=3157093 RepID=UPI0033E8B4B0
MRTGSGRGAARDRVTLDTERTSEPRQRAEGPVDGRWLVLGKDGRLTAYARTASALLRWTEQRPGGPEWDGPEAFPVAGLTHLSVAQGADTYVHFVGRREVRKGEGAPVVDIVHAIQYQTGRAVTEWRSLGNPHKDQAKAVRLGIPAAAISSSGTVYVFTRNAGGGVMLRRELPGGKWGPWTDLKGSQAQDPMALVAHSSGHVEAMVPGKDVVMRWVQDQPEGDFRQAPNIPVAVARGSAVALETAPGRTTYFWTDPTTGGLAAHRPGSWVFPLGGAPDDSPVAALRTVLDGYDCTVLAHRDVQGQVMLSAFGTENEQAGAWWSATGERCTGAPGLARDAHGRVVLGMIGADGALHIARQTGHGGFEMARSERV